MTTRNDDEAGSTVVEFALIAVTVFSIIIGLITFSVTEIGNSAGSNAAREGARTGSLGALDADQPGSPNNVRVVNAVRSRLGGTVVGSPVVTVSCLDGTTGLPRATGCDATASPDSDLVKVAVRWTHSASSAFLPSSTSSDSSTAVIVSLTPAPVATTSTCSISNATATPSPQSIGASTAASLPNDLVITGTASAGCSGSVYAVFYTGTEAAGAPAHRVAMAGTTSLSVTVPKASYSWAPGTYPITFGDSTTAIYPGGIDFSVTSTAVCSILSASANPASVALARPEPSSLATSVTVDVSTTTSCPSALYTTFATGTNGADQQIVLVTRLGTGSYRYSLGSTDFVTWTAGSKTFSFDDGPSGATTYPGAKAALQVTAPSSVAGIELKNLVASGPGTTATGCAPAPVTSSYTCTVSGLPNKGSITAAVAFVAASGTPLSGSTSSSTVTFSPPTGGTSLTNTPLTIPGGASTSSTTFTFTEPPGNAGGSTTITVGSYTLTLVIG